MWEHPLGQIIKKSFDLLGHYTSISLEIEFWDALQEIAQSKNCSIRKLVLQIDQDRLGTPLPLNERSGDLLKYPNLSSSIRVFVLNYYQRQCDLQQK